MHGRRMPMPEWPGHGWDRGAGPQPFGTGEGSALLAAPTVWLGEDCLTGFPGTQRVRNKEAGNPKGPLEGRGRRHTLFFLSHLQTDVLNIPSSDG